MPVPAAAAGRFATDLKAAIAAGKIQPFFQPIVSRGDARLVGVEALARWVKPDGTVVPPADFITQAEAGGLIVPLGTHILRQAMHCARDWPGINLSINVSPLQLQEPDFEAIVSAALADTGFAAADLTLEVTETAAMSAVGPSLENLTRLRLRGFGLSIDDYGTGYSSLQQLARVPFTELKIEIGRAHV